MTPDQLKAIMPTVNPAWSDPLNTAMNQYQINTPKRIAAFLATLAVESQELNRLEENLNYSAQRLRQVFPREFPDDATAARYANSPHGIASRVYANRFGNGDEASGDGWTYRGRGLIQITFKGNYEACARGINDPLLVNCPDRLCTKSGAAWSAAWFFQSRGCNPLADEGNMEAITRHINGNAEELLDRRIAYYKKALEVLNGSS